MSFKKFDYIIIGAGASGLQLALALLRDDFYKNKTIGIIEKKSKFKNDKTWCYWETGKGLYDEITHASWKSGCVKAKNNTVNFDLKDYTYKMLRSADFYKYAKTQIDKSPQIEWIEDDIIKAQSHDNIVEITGNKNRYTAQHTFDSRLPTNYKPQNSINILQHFKGWFIETDKDVFDPERFCMMDYSLKDKNTTSFIYILPFSKNKALVEFTYFSPEKVSDKTYEDFIKTHLSEKLNLSTYNIYEKEQGVIPMTSYPFYKNHQEHITKIGTSGGWVKSSTGYSFKNSERFAFKIVNNIKAGKSPHDNLFQKRFKHYDKLFLDVLYQHNDYGEKLFYNMYKRNKIRDIFQFLDEQTQFAQELKIMFSMTSYYFIKAFFKHAVQGFKIK